MEPSWLQGKPNQTATITRFIPGQNDSPAMVVRLDAPIAIDQITGQVLVLELRYNGASWDKTNTVHIELCDFEPEPKRWQNRRQGTRIESLATCDKVYS